MSQHTVLHGDVWAGLKQIPDESVDCAITSPPYYDQRDYGFQGQIGTEKTLDEYFAKLVTIYSLLRKKLSRKGVFYHNIGDKYSSKYGNTSLLMIPYILTEYMKQDGWILVDTIIWHKPNHMPSGVETRFTNSYEPVFVFAREKNNYYSIYKEKNQQSNIIHINLQPSKNKHVAMFPEKLVECLIQMGIPNNATILDPFAGSGTTSLVSQKLSNNCKQNSLLDDFPIKHPENKNQLNFRTIMIEANQEFVEILKKRCIVDKVTCVEFERFEVNKLITIKYDNSASTDSTDFTNFKYDFVNDYAVYIEP
ncbi:MAG: site-specific DNA-methyltransferase, partial [Candidatus Heimdallarchaeota archaeon]